MTSRKWFLLSAAAALLAFVLDVRKKLKGKSYPTSIDLPMRTGWGDWVATQEPQKTNSRA